ncbi:hypothetical protein ACRCUN_18370 [Mycobacterium sp. LTG2003]
MPKRAVSGREQPGYVPAPLQPWRATGLSLAVIASAAFNGIGTLCAAIVAAAVIYALVRLHRDAPQSPSTGDLVASKLGSMAGRFTSLIQLVAYAVLGVGAAAALGLQPLTGVADPETALASWWWPAWSVTTVVAAAAIVAQLPTRAVGAMAAVLAGVGLLVYFYLGLAVMAKVASGTSPHMYGPAGFPSALLMIAAVIPLALGLAGFEAATAASSRLSSVGRPLGAAVAVTVLCAATLLVATNISTIGGFHYDAGYLSLIAVDLFGELGRYCLITGGVCLSAAAALAAMWAAMYVSRRLFGAGLVPAVLLPAAMCVLAVAICRFQTAVGSVALLTAALLLLIVYLLVAEANSRIEGDGLAAQAPRALMAVVLVGAVLIPLRADDFAVQSLWPVAVTAVVVGVAALLARVGTQAQRSPLPH